MVELARNNERKLELAGGGEGAVCGQYHCHQCPPFPCRSFLEEDEDIADGII